MGLEGLSLVWERQNRNLMVGLSGIDLDSVGDFRIY